MSGAHEGAMQASYEASMAAKKAEAAKIPEKKYPREQPREFSAADIGGTEKSFGADVDHFSSMETAEDKDRAVEKYLAEALPPEIANTPEAKAAIRRFVDMAVSSVRKGLEAGKDATTLNMEAEKIMKTKAFQMVKQELGIIDAKRAV